MFCDYISSLFNEVTTEWQIKHTNTVKAVEQLIQEFKQAYINYN